MGDKGGVGSISRTKDLTQIYKIKELIARGGFSTVRRCLRRTDKHPFALKIVRKKRRKFKSTFQKLVGQLLIVDKLTHPNLCKTLMTFNTPNYIHMVMEYCSTYDVFEYLHEQATFCEQQAAEAIRQISVGLTYMHENKVCHRDIKPENILVYHHPTTGAVLYKIISFGFAKEFSNGCNTLCGSPEYVAPEIIQPNSVYYEQVDFWALGVLMYTMLCGYSPFYDEDTKVIYRLIRKHALSFDVDVWGDISKLSADLIKKLLRLNPNRRFDGAAVRSHEWMKNESTKPLASDYIRMFHLRQKLISGVQTIISVIRFKNVLEDCAREMDELERSEAGEPMENKATAIKDHNKSGSSGTTTRRVAVE